MYKLKKATKEDIDQLIDLRILEQINDWKDLCTITSENLKQLSQATRKSFLKRLNKDLIMFVIKKDDKIVAQAGLLLQTFLPQMDDFIGKRAYLCNVFTIETERRKKLQLILSDEIVKYCQNEGIRRIDLHASLSQEIFDMYKKLGYQFVTNNARLLIENYHYNNLKIDTIERE